MKPKIRFIQVLLCIEADNSGQQGVCVCLSNVIRVIKGLFDDI